MALKEEKVPITSGKKKARIRKEPNAVSGTTIMSVQKAAPSSEPPTPRGRSASRKRTLRGRSQFGKTNRQPCKYFLEGTCTKSPCDYRHPPECQFCKSESSCKFGAECLLPHWKVEEQPNKKPKKGDDKSAAAFVKSVRQLSCVSEDTEPPESTVRISKNPTTVVTANGEVPARGEATENVRELNLFVTVMLLEETPAVFFTWKTLRRTWV